MIIYYYNILLFVGATIILLKTTQLISKKTIGEVNKEKVKEYQKQFMKTSLNVARQKENFMKLAEYAGTNIDAYKELIKMTANYFLPIFTFIIPLEIIMREKPLAKIRGFEITWAIILLLLLAGVIINKIIQYVRKKKEKNQ